MAHSPAEPGTPRVSKTLVRLSLIGAVLLVAIGALAFWYASTRLRPDAATAGDRVTVTIRDKTCEPAELTVPAGKVGFTIVNQSDRAVEWEILDGVMVLEERENIAPGFSQTLDARLSPGTYEITCGLLSNPRGKLVVTPSEASAAAANRPPLTAFIGPLAEYQVYLMTEAATLAEQVGALGDAIQAGDLEKARQLYAPARAAYQHIEPVALRFGDLDNAIDARAELFEQREADPAFVGFHRIEQGLFQAGSTAGLAPVAAKLVADIGTLNDRIGELRLPPEQLAKGAAAALERIAGSGVLVSENRYAQADLADAAASVEGSREVVGLLRPLVEKARLDLAKELDAALAAADAELAAHADPLDDAARKAIGGKLQALAGSIGRINAAIGLE